MRKKVLLSATAAVIALTAAAAPELASASSGAVGSAKRTCAAQFERAQWTDMTSFRDFDANTWRRGHAADAVSIFASGDRFVGIGAIMAAARSHFENKNAVWSWTELGRHVDGCRSAFIEYDANYDIPSIGFHQKALTVVSYVYRNGRWLGVLDQGTLLELTPATSANGRRMRSAPIG